MLNSPYQQYTENGFCFFNHDTVVLDWVKSTLPAARFAVSAKENQHWFRHGKTWFVGVNVLNNNRLGQLESGPQLSGHAVNFIEKFVIKGKLSIDKGQISVCYRGYPQPSNEESDAAYGYRLRRDAAHVDGIMRDGENRYLVEHHDYILALPMTRFSADAAPFVVWKGSHKIIQDTLSSFLASYPVDKWKSVPISDVYNQARKEIFANCQRIEMALKPGESFVGHRHLLHGTAPWQPSAKAGLDGRMICFFRPESLTVKQWVLQQG